VGNIPTVIVVHRSGLQPRLLPMGRQLLGENSQALCASKGGLKDKDARSRLSVDHCPTGQEKKP
jgi:hypothetical protein